MLGVMYIPQNDENVVFPHDILQRIAFQGIVLNHSAIFGYELPEFAHVDCVLDFSVNNPLHFILHGQRFECLHYTSHLTRSLDFTRH